MKPTTQFILAVSIVFSLLGAMLLGAKYHGHFRLGYHKVLWALNLVDKPQRPQPKQRVLEQPYKETSILDLPSVLNPKDHQVYLAELKHKYSGAAPVPKMIKIPKGEFLMGCQNTPCYQPPLPAHKVTVPAFEMAVTEVTFEQWDTCVAMGGCFMLPGDLGFGRGDRPVMFVSWDTVVSQYLPWLNENTQGNYRLPSEAEWEYAARAGTTTARYWGNQAPSCDPDSPFGASWGAQPWWKNQPRPCPNPGTTVPVASFAPNPWGLYDMLGSTHEWTNDCENGRNYVNAPNDGSAWQGSVCSRRVVRGGAWTSDSSNMSVSMRKVYDKHMSLERVGFRLARTISD